MTTVCMTGGTGYAGRCVISDILEFTDWDIVSIQRKITLGAPVERIQYVEWDFRTPFDLSRIFLRSDDLKYFLHLGAEVHALRSLTDPGAFVQGNIVGTQNVLDLARALEIKLFVYMSTAEVLGGRDTGSSLEDDPLKPSNPYAASKAAGELLTQAYGRCYGLPSIVVRTMNLYGDGQNDPTKFVCMVEDNLRAGRMTKIHVRDGKPGSRQWITGRSFAHQLVELVQRAEPGLIYHIVGTEMTNLEMATRVAAEMGKDLKCEMVPISKTHEFRYAMQATR
jgi:dTDP-glucose 4,6-dehydratase